MNNTVVTLHDTVVTENALHDTTITSVKFRDQTKSPQESTERYVK